MAPTTAPTQVLAMLSCLRGVYTPAYSTMLAAPSAVVSGLVCRYTHTHTHAQHTVREVCVLYGSIHQWVEMQHTLKTGRGRGCHTAACLTLLRPPPPFLQHTYIHLAILRCPIPRTTLCVLYVCMLLLLYINPSLCVSACCCCSCSPCLTAPTAQLLLSPEQTPWHAVS